MSTVPRSGDLPPLRLGLPAYGYPGETELWAEVARVPPGSVVVLDPADGPGAVVDLTYVAVLEAARQGGAVMYGYVDTDYGRRPVDEMLADARRHIEWYSVAGVFLDQTPGPRSSPVEAVIAALRAWDLRVAVNPGQPTIAPRWVALADHVVVFEGEAATYGGLALPAWMRHYPADRYWHLVYDVADAQTALSVMRRAASLGAGVVHVTDGALPNPWRRLPPYWAEELAALPARGAPVIRHSR